MTTEAQLYDQLAEWFGIGEWDEKTSRLPYYKARMTEIGKLKRLMKSRHVTVETMLEVASYAHTQHKPVTATWELVEMIPEARSYARQHPTGLTLHDELSAAVEEALAAGEQGWAERLASGVNRDVLDAWRSRG